MLNTNSQQANTNIFDQSIFLSLTLSKFTLTRKGDKSKITTDASLGMVTFGKKLLDSKEYAEIVALDTSLYQYLDWKEGQRSLPFRFKRGIYMIPLRLVNEVKFHLSQMAAKRNILIQEFLDVYPATITQAKELLGSQFNAKDYPTDIELKHKFAMDFDFFSFNVPDSLKDVNFFLYEEQKKKIQKQCQDATAEITQILRAEALEYINTLISKLDPDLKGRAKRLDDSYLERMKDFFNVFQARNIANDQELAQAIEIARKAIGGVSAEDFKDNDSLKARVRAEFQQATNVFDAMVEDNDDYGVDTLEPVLLKAIAA